VKRLAVVLVPFAVCLSACAVGAPQPATSPTSTSIVLNAKVASSVDGPTDYWFRYGERGDQANWSETSHQAVEVTEGEAEPVSASLEGLEPDHRYGWQACVADRQEDPPRVVCSTERQFGTIGDHIFGGHGNYGAVSGPGGENPEGSAGNEAVTCLRLGGGTASIGVASGVYYFSPLGGGADGVYRVDLAPWPAGSDHTNCPQTVERQETFFFDQRLDIYDAP
jgi:hypothetical protein